ncbi:hypothetical protein KSK37_13740 [Kaistella sp. DKR-2]|uniref:hypothetical protein n=1 Tax=Kaistella soli TaxID=2849654 RepID=UPI001C266765|nr:hypothetical protein [Kaistella soli]MBU8884149.1 hypothetical protein [Kaistella soli]
MFELFMILLGLNFTNTINLPADIGQGYQTETEQSQNDVPPDTGGETQPIPPRK